MATRNELENKFQNGARPSGDDFAALINSFLHKTEDGLTFDERSIKNLRLPGGLKLGDSNSSEPGTLRLNTGRVQFYDGSKWADVGGGGAFQPIGTTGAVTYAGGNVGIGSDFASTSPPTYRLEVPLKSNTATSTSERVRFGAAVFHTGATPDQGYAYLSHVQQANSNKSYGFRQAPSGEVYINAPLTQSVYLSQDGDTIRLAVTANTGHVIVGSDSDLSGASAYPFQVNGSAFIQSKVMIQGTNVSASDFALQVNGKVCNPSGEWSRCSDIRVKEDIRDLEAGLDQLMRVRPVRFRYNGKAGTPKGQESVGVIGQEIETIFPEMVERIASMDEIGSDDEPLRIYNGSALTYVLVNAVKELAGRVKELENTLAQLQQAPQPPTNE
ncbi:MAG: hypothetical protein B0A82_26645 [Alkalinema sp. CACIAM 70d]|nr:MAG: hypothetical protein B0A82_26645 [Alkalinema sp. CACIAM 70d]